ncbi:hypothetical protein [Aquimarina aggregata]|uniref:hypothetical protein n=1 Tax=Aquimarina aggregata TaxID=1642818 RepID=UPI0024915AC3|nr:hypothetical protein [Aquimarina aggregata]
MNRLLYILFFLFISCDNTSKIKLIDIYYLPNDTTTQTPVDCSSLYGDWKPELQNHKINKNKTLKNIEYLLTHLNNEVEESKNLSQDVRIRCMIHFKNKKTDTLCLGESFDTYLNGQKVQDVPELFSLLKKELDYENSYKRIKPLPR